VALKPETPLSTHEAPARAQVVIVLSCISTETQGFQTCPGRVSQLRRTATGKLGAAQVLSWSLRPLRC